MTPAEKKYWSNPALWPLGDVIWHGGQIGFVVAPSRALWAGSHDDTVGVLLDDGTIHHLWAIELAKKTRIRFFR